MSLFPWVKRSTAKPSVQQAFAVDMRRALLFAAKNIKCENRKGQFESFMAFPLTFGSIMQGVREKYGDHIIDMNSPAAQIVCGVAEGGEAQRAVQSKLDVFMSMLRETEGDEERTLALMASMLNEHRWNEIIDGRIVLPAAGLSPTSIDPSPNRTSKEVESLVQLRRATATISTEPLNGDETEIAGTAASILTIALVNSTISQIQDDDDRFTAGMFAFVAADHFSRMTAGSFELASVISMIRTLGTDEFERCFTAIEASHRKMVGSNSKVVLAIGQNCAIWLKQPTSENFQKLAQLFWVVRQSSTEAS